MCLFFVLLSIRRQGLPPNKEAYEKHMTDLGSKLDVYEKTLSKQKYLLGEVRLVSPPPVIHKCC